MLARTPTGLEAATHAAPLTVTCWTAPVGLCLLDADLRFVVVNADFASLGGSTPAEHVGKAMAETTPNLARLIEPKCRDTLSGGEPMPAFEIEGRLPGSLDTRWWICRCQPVVESDGRVHGVTCALVDITERKRIEHAQRIAPQHLLHQPRQPVEAPAHVRRAGGQPDTHARWRADHASSAAARRATAAASVVAATRSTRPLRSTTSIGVGAMSDTDGSMGDAGAASGATKRTGSSRGGGGRRRGTSPRAARRQRCSRLVQTPCRRDTAVTVSPGWNVSATRRTFSSALKLRRRSPRVTISTRSEGTVPAPVLASVPATPLAIASPPRWLSSQLSTCRSKKGR